MQWYEQKNLNMLAQFYGKAIAELAVVAFDQKIEI